MAANIPGIPSPPTDNLFKFLAIFGLVLFIAGTGFRYYEQDSQIKRASIDDKYKAVVAEFDYLTEQFPKGTKVSETVILRKASLIREMHETQAIFDANTDEQSRGRERVMIASKIQGTGIVLCLAGFVIWFVFVQFPELALLDYQVQTKKIEYERLKESRNAELEKAKDASPAVAEPETGE